MTNILTYITFILLMFAGHQALAVYMVFLHFLTSIVVYCARRAARGAEEI